jgi:hypothetical protein
MTRARRDGDHDDDDAKPISDEEIAEHQAQPQPAPRDVLAIEGLRWVYSPGVTILQYQTVDGWQTVPSVTLTEAESQ